MKIIIINGPNLNLLGTRETNIYGKETFDDYLSKLKKKYRQVELSYFQSNVEGELINYIQEVGFDSDGTGFDYDGIGIDFDDLALIMMELVSILMELESILMLWLRF